MKRRRYRNRASIAGFTLIETLIATALMVAVLGGARHRDGAVAAELESRFCESAANRTVGGRPRTHRCRPCRRGIRPAESSEQGAAVRRRRAVRHFRAIGARPELIARPRNRTARGDRRWARFGVGPVAHAIRAAAAGGLGRQPPEIPRPGRAGARPVQDIVRLCRR